MELEKAYNKIDNFCCSNHNTLQGNKVKYLNNREETIDMFRDYQETKDGDFCKDANEMVEALDTIKNLVNLQKELGCPLEVVFKALTNGIYIENIYGEMVNFKVMLVYKNKELGYYFRFINDGYILLDGYKVTWWLRKDKSE